VVLAVSARLSSADPLPLLKLCQSLPCAEILFWTGTGEPSIRLSTETYLRTTFACLDDEKNENDRSSGAAATPIAPGAVPNGGAMDAAAAATGATVAAAKAAPSTTTMSMLHQSRVGFDVARGGNLWLEAQVTTWRYLKWGQSRLIGL